MDGPFRPTLAYSEQRIRIDYATKRPERPLQEVCAVWWLAAQCGGPGSRCYLYSHPTHEGASYSLAESRGDIDKEALVDEIRDLSWWKRSWRRT